VEPEALALGGHVATGLEGTLKEGEVGSLEEGGGGADGVRRVGDDDVVLVLVLGEELEAVTDEDLDTGVVVALGELGEVELGDADDGLVNVAKGDLLDRLVLEGLTDDTTVTATDDKDLLGVGVRVDGEVGDHLLVPVVLVSHNTLSYRPLGDSRSDGSGIYRCYSRELVTLRDLDGAVKDEDVAVGLRLEDEDILVAGLARRSRDKPQATGQRERWCQQLRDCPDSSVLRATNLEERLLVVENLLDPGEVSTEQRLEPHLMVMAWPGYC
jgi:hypothetical protein